MPISSTLYNQSDAASLCSGTINGQGGWRLPTQPELSALYAAYPDNTGSGNSMLLGQGWALLMTWSSTSYGTSAGYYYYVYLNDGYFIWTGDTFGFYVTCVR